MSYEAVMEQIKNTQFSGVLTIKPEFDNKKVFKTYGDVHIKAMGNNSLILFIDEQGRFHKILAHPNTTIHLKTNKKIN